MASKPEMGSLRLFMSSTTKRKKQGFELFDMTNMEVKSEDLLVPITENIEINGTVKDGELTCHTLCQNIWHLAARWENSHAHVVNNKDLNTIKH